jgi:hypothetical protein
MCRAPILRVTPIPRNSTPVSETLYEYSNFNHLSFFSRKFLWHVFFIAVELYPLGNSIKPLILLASYLAYSSTLKIEAIYSSETCRSVVQPQDLTVYSLLLMLFCYFRTPHPICHSRHCHQSTVSISIHFICGLFRNAFSKSGYITSNWGHEVA